MALSIWYCYSLVFISLCFGFAACQSFQESLLSEETVLSEDKKTLTISFFFYNGNIQNPSQEEIISVPGQDNCDPVKQEGNDTGTAFSYEFKFGDETALCKGNESEVSNGDQREYMAEIHFLRLLTFPVPITLMNQMHRFSVRVNILPTSIPTSLQISLHNTEQTNFMAGNSTQLIIGFTGEDTVWKALSLEECTVSNNAEMNDDPSGGNYAVKALVNKCPVEVNVGDFVGEILGKPQRVPSQYSRASMDWTLRPFPGHVSGGRVYLRCVVDLCDSITDPACSLECRTEVTTKLNSETAVDFSLPLQLPTTPAPPTPTTPTTPSTASTPSTPSTPTTPTTPTTPSTPPTPTTTPTTPGLPDAQLALNFYVRGALLTNPRVSESESVQLKIQHIDVGSSQYTALRLESCQISNNAEFNYNVGQELYVDTFISDGCPQLTIMHVGKVTYAEEGEVEVDFLAFRYEHPSASEDQTQYFRCVVRMCTQGADECPQTCQPSGSKLMSALRATKTQVVTSVLHVAEGPRAAAAAECPEGEECMEEPYFYSMVALLGGFLLLALVVGVVEAVRVAKYRQKLIYERRPIIGGYDNYAASRGNGRAERRGSGYNSRGVVY